MGTPQNKKLFRPTAPIKGSFPLDHDGVCKEEMIKYMICLKTSKNSNNSCREGARDYFQCRMDNGLMEKEEWGKLGFSGSAPVARSDSSSKPS